MVDVITVVYVCGRCFSADSAPGPCPRCALPRVRCEPGGLADPSRQPPSDAHGRLLSRAPVWWLRAWHAARYPSQAMPAYDQP